MIDGTYNAKESRFDVVKKFLARRLTMTTKDTRVWSVIGLAVATFLLLSEAHRAGLRTQQIERVNELAHH